MEITQEQIDEFKRIYKDTFDEEISEDRAYDLALPLLQLFRVVCRPLPRGHRCRACQLPEEPPDFDKTSNPS